MKTYLFTAIILMGTIIISCKDEEETTLVGNWVKRSDFEGVARCGAVSFVIGSKIYLGLGYDGKTRRTDLWEYDPAKNAWSERNPFPGEGRNAAIAFSVNLKGYIGLGFNGDSSLADFWEYNSGDDIWVRKQDFAGSARYGSVAFAIDGKGYVCAGYDGNYLKDLWQYEPETDSWIQKTSMGGSKRINASVFVINKQAYVCTGTNNGAYVTDMWMYSTEEDLWTEKRKISNSSTESYDDSYVIIRASASIIVVNSKAYLTCGENGSILSDTWEYDPLSDIWTQKSAFEGSARIEAVGFSVENRGFVVTGRSSSYKFDDMYEFLPGDAQNKND